jgi:hypothetical protein
MVFRQFTPFPPMCYITAHRKQSRSSHVDAEVRIPQGHPRTGLPAPVHRLGSTGRLDGEAPVAAYIGFDATADSLHVGSMVQIMLLRRLQQTGHKPIALMGGGTTKIGDPSGRDESRKLLTEEDINRNLTASSRPSPAISPSAAARPTPSW